MNSRSSKIYLLIATTLGSFLTPFMSSSITVSLPYIGKEFNADAIILNWIATSFLLSAAVFLVPFGRLSDIIGRKIIFIIGILIFAASSFLIMMINSITFLIIFRIIQGIGGSMIFCTSTALVSSHFEPNERGKAMGLLVTAVYAGISLGPFAGGYITQFAGWRYLFLLNGIIGIITFLFSIKKIANDRNILNNEKFDYLGSLIYAVSLTSLIFGFSKLPTFYGFFFTVFGIVGIIGFFLFEKRLTFPVLNVNLLLNNKVFAFSNLAALINYSATFAISFLLSFYLQFIKGLTPKDTGIILITQPIIMTIFSPITGKLSDKIEPRILSSLGMLLTSIGLFLFFLIQENTSLNYIIMDLIIVGLGFALFSSPNMNAIMSSIEKKFYGVGAATQSTMRLVGQMFSMGIVMIIFTLITGEVQISKEVHIQLLYSIKIAFLIFTILCIFGIYTSSIRGKLR